MPNQREEINVNIIVKIIVNGEELIINDLNIKEDYNGLQCDFQKEK